MRPSLGEEDHGVMSNSTNAPSAKYYAWLQASAEQARNEKELPARILAACEIKGEWILSGQPICPPSRLGDRFWEGGALHPKLYQEMVARIEHHARRRGISEATLSAARQAIDQLTFEEVFQLAAMQNLFETVMPELVLVMSVQNS